MDLSSLNLRRWVFIILAMMCLTINIIAFVLYQKNQSIQSSKQWVTHTYEVINHMQTLYSDLQDMLTAQRGYLLTGEDRFLTPYYKTKPEIETNFNELLFLVSDNQQRVDEVKVFRQITGEQIALLDNQIKRKQEDGAITYEDMATNKVYMDRIRAMNEKLLDSESRLLEVRAAHERQLQHNYIMTIFISAALSVLGLVVASGMIFFLGRRRKAAEDNLVRINKEMEGFTYIASHDLRSPLVNLKGFSSEMRYGLEEMTPIIERLKPSMTEEERQTTERVFGQDIPDSLKFIHSSVEKMDRLTNAILELSRIGRRTLTLETVNTNKIVARCLDTLNHIIASRKIQVKVHPLPTVEADSLSVEQVFGNVIDNAIKYLDPQREGRIEIGGSRSYRQTTFWVRDNGRGINSHDMQKIFEIYRRGGNNRDVEGEGMGMAYVRSTLRRLGGTIWCDSTEGAGTTFYFTISNSLRKDGQE